MKNFIVVKEDTLQQEVNGRLEWVGQNIFTVIYRYQSPSTQEFNGKAKHDNNFYYVVEVPNEWNYNYVKVTNKNPWVFVYDSVKINELKETLKQDIDLKYESEKLKNYTFTFDNSTSATFAITQELRDGLLTSNGLSSVQWSTTSGASDRKTFTGSEFKRLGNELFNRGQTLYIKKITLKTVLESKTNSQLIDYDIQTEWNSL